MANKYLEVARQLACLSRCRTKHAALIIKKGEVVAAGTNLRGLDPSFTARWVPNTHAERNVLRQAGTTAKGSTLIVVRVNKRGHLMPSEPCSWCLSGIQRAGVSRVVHS